jgi:hypothetical protein
MLTTPDDSNAQIVLADLMIESEEGNLGAILLDWCATPACRTHSLAHTTRADCGRLFSRALLSCTFSAGLQGGTVPGALTFRFASTTPWRYCCMSMARAEAR